MLPDPTSASPVALGYPVPRSVRQADTLMPVAFYSALFFAFILFSRLTELGPLRPLHLAAVGMGISLTSALVAGTWQKALAGTSGKLFLALTVWILVCIPFSIWPGGSFFEFHTNWLPALALFVVCAGSVSNWRYFIGIVRVVAISLFFAVCSVLASGSMSSGRLTGEDGFFSNPNDLGTIIAIAMPLFWLLAGLSKRYLIKVFWIALTIPMWLAFSQTGSRGGLLGFTAMALFFLLRASILRKIQFIGSAVFLLVVASVLVPDKLLVRFMSLPGLVDSSAESDLTTAQASATARQKMVIMAVSMTFQNPIFGVGSGNFKVRSTELFKAKDEVPPWTDVHNTFFQMSSENGIPAFVLFLAIVVCSWKGLTRVIKSSSDRSSPYARAAFNLKLSFVAFIVCGSFGNYAYQYHLPILAALAFGLYRARLDGRQDQLPKPMGRPAAWPLPPAIRTAGSPQYRFGRVRAS